MDSDIINNFIKGFLLELNNNKVSYVHWKSNLNIDKALFGSDDLDILVSEKDSPIIKKIFKKLNIIRAYSKKDSWQKLIFHYIGCDKVNQKLIHIHLHYSLEIGYDFDKRYNLPIVEDYIRENFLYKDIVFLPKIENEYIILILRLVLKNAFIPFILQSPYRQIKTLISRNEGVIKGNGYQEFLDLNNKINRSKIHLELNKTFNFLSLRDFKFLEESILKNNSVLGYFKAAKVLSSSIKAYRVHNDVTSFFKSFFRIIPIKIEILKNRLFNPSKQGSKTPENGGKIIAFLGGDGAGKTTNISSLRGVLKSHFRVYILHIGRPDKTMFGYLLYQLHRVVKFIGLKSFGLCLYYLGIAIDRKSTYKKASKLKNSGAIVLLDRLPIKEIQTMDCPRIHVTNNYPFLSKIECKIYEGIKNVDLILVLRLNPEIALKRRPNDNVKELLNRSGSIWNLNWNDVKRNIIVINAADPLPEVKKEIIKHVWKEINRKYLRYEIIGLPGTGKSTIISSLNLNKKIQSSLSLKKYPKQTLITFFYNFSEIVKIIIRKNKYNYVLNYILLKTTISLFEKNEKEGKNYLSENYIFDQGPYFQIAMGIKEGLWNNPEKIKKSLQILNKNIERVYFLEAPLHVLWDRVNSREQSHREKNSDFVIFSNFCNDYEKSFKLVLKNIEVTNINTSDQIVNDIVSEILAVKG